MLSLEQCGEVADYIMERTRHVIESFGPRPPGSEAEHQTQELVRSELQNYCDGEVRMEAFRFSPLAFFSMQRVSGVLLLCAIGAYWFSSYAAVACSLAAALVLYCELLRYNTLIDPFFHRGTSYNVWGQRKACGEIKRRIVLNAHPDAAYEWRFLYRYPTFFKPIMIYVIIGSLFVIGLHIAFALLSNGWSGGYAGLWLYLGLAQLLFVPAAVFGILFNDFRYVSPGANDNLSGTFLVTGIARAFNELGISFENTEVLFLITGAEEAGLRGAKAFAKAHQREFDDIETVFVALDTFRDLEHFAVYSRDLNGTVAHDARVCKLLKDAGTACGLDLPYSSVFLGSSDASAFSQIRWEAAALAAMDPAPADYYHNRRDTWENMDRECLVSVAQVVTEAVRRFDTEGLPTI